MFKYSLLAGVVLLSVAASTVPDVKHGEYRLAGVGQTQNPNPSNPSYCQYNFTPDSYIAESSGIPSMLYYSGAGKSGSTLHFYGYFQDISGNTIANHYGMLSVVLPTAPISGISVWSGSASVTFTPVGPPTYTKAVFQNQSMPFAINFVRGDDFWLQGTYSIMFPDGCSLGNSTQNGLVLPLIGVRTGTI